ncbi:MAG: acyl carrier protein [Clostridia bacterium]|jgi:acyl carrier protein|nr:acyl carrier protein [Clostridia bacterium]MBQ5955999.1 acyl carrier protein [Clostridia bacterium]MBR0437669.1 acyl carrier protein [Clostridia bacterium]MBR4623695.1 acyl carrier protein [Clostridia bacterium]MBR6822054.1 acyl carrier protein [Clostridia bacterium]
MTFEKLKEIIMKETGKKDIELTDETTFKDLGFDSIDAIDILMDIEDEFGIEIQDDSEALNNVGDLVKLIEEKINA